MVINENKHYSGAESGLKANLSQMADVLIASSNLDMIGVTEIGQRSDSVWEGLILGTGVMRA